MFCHLNRAEGKGELEPKNKLESFCIVISELYSFLVLVVLMSVEKSTIDLQLHMAVKSLAVFQGEINCKVDELIKKVKALQEKEQEGEKTDYLLKMVSDNLDELQELVKQRNNLRIQIEKLEKTEIQLMKD